ncbi:2-isopropylmalate synthase [Bacillus cereus]|uniref:homocitrate synthase/isopropylmalate synthase family protein n=1 Tax=Bacillus cereus TaxID=1396 RepID=UPI002852A65D|nr:2-isopropylmalate synthase [Bacillus cereus]WLE91103.1 Homocitrate synthase [Bacillus cereus]
MNRNITILDATLREGEQQCGIRFSKEDKITLLHMIENFGIRLIEVGHPGISDEEEKICREVAVAAKQADILMHARAKKEEVHAAYRAGADWIGIWASVNPISLQTKYTNRSKDYVMNQVKQAIEEARYLGMKIRFTIEDASRTTWEDISYLGKIAYQAGANRISLADTVGIWEPNECAAIVKKAFETFPCEIEVHLHNDLGLALANALAAIDAGATVIDATLCGIGERSGIVDLLNLSVILQQKRNIKNWKINQIPKLVQALELASGHRIDACRPIIGKNAFTHTSSYHVKAVQQNPVSYEGIPAHIVGRKSTLGQMRGNLLKPRLSQPFQIGRPFIKGASELRYHRDGPGYRWVQLDTRIDSRASFYVIQRQFYKTCSEDVKEGHVDAHIHNCDSAFLFWGNQLDGSGLICEVEIEKEKHLVISPASIFIPAGLVHTYRYVYGQGTYTNIVLAPNYNDSLLEYVPITSK